jgi:hypothetical protein
MTTTKIKKPRFRQYFALHSNTVSAKEGVVVKILSPLEVQVTCMLYNANGEGCLEICVSFKNPKWFMKTFNLGSVDEVKGIGRKEVLKVWRDKMLEEEGV